MFKTILLIGTLIPLLLAQLQCTTVQYWAVVSDENSMYPYASIREYLEMGLELDDIAFVIK